MADKADDKGKKEVEIELTEDQKKVLCDTFGPDFNDKVKSVKVEQIAGFLRAGMTFLN